MEEDLKTPIITEIEVNGKNYNIGDPIARTYAYTKAESDDRYVHTEGSSTITGGNLTSVDNSFYVKSNNITSGTVNESRDGRGLILTDENDSIVGRLQPCLVHPNQQGIILEGRRKGTGNNVYLNSIYLSIDQDGNKIVSVTDPAAWRAALGVPANSHNHSAAQINSGTFGVARGGTGASTLASGEVLIGNGTNTINTRAITNNTNKGNLGWTSASANGINLVTLNTLAYWNGEYSSGKSNITSVGTITSGTWNGTAIKSSYVDDLPASKITSGTFDAARIPSFNASKINAGTLAIANGGTGLSSTSANFVFAGPSSASGAPSWRKLGTADIPSLNASKITAGTFDAARIPGLDASKITTGTISKDRIPGLNASKINAGTLPISYGGTGYTGVNTSTTSSTYITTITGVTISNVKVSKWGPLVSIYFEAKPAAEKTEAWQVCTINSGYRPSNNITTRPYYSSVECARMNTDGKVYMTAAKKDSVIPVSFTYIVG